MHNVVPIAACLVLLSAAAHGQESQNKSQSSTNTSPVPTVTVRVPSKDELGEAQQERQFNDLMDKEKSAYGGRRYEEALPNFLLAAKLAENLRENRDRYLGDALKYEGHCYRDMQRYQEAESAYLRRADALKVWPGTLDSEYAGNFLYLSVAQILNQDWKKAEEYCSKSVAAYEAAIEHFKELDDYQASDIVANDDRFQESRALFYQAAIYANEERTDLAVTTFEKAYDLNEKFPWETGDSGPNYAKGR